MPLGDWQFWVVTAAAAASVVALIRVLTPARPRGKRTTLTVERRRPER